MSIKSEYRQRIFNEFANCVNNTISRMNSSEQTNRPFHTALLSRNIIYWSGFERSFSTSFGQRTIEELARLAALSGGAEDAKRQKETNIEIDMAYDNAIHSHIERLRSGNRSIPYDWESSLNEIKSITLTGRTKQMRIISDLWWKKDGIDNFVSLKTVKPNIDQTAVAKEDCLHLSIALPNSKTYFALPYNPYGNNKEDYAHNPPMGIFDFRHDSAVLIGKEFWDTLGGEGFYEELLDIAEEVGEKTRQDIDAILNRGN